MDDRIFNILQMVPVTGVTYREIIYVAADHEINLWRVCPGDWIYPHIHPGSDDIWYIVQGEGEYYKSVKEKKPVRPGDVTVASMGEVHGIFNSGSEDIVIHSVLAPLPVEIEEAPGFEYPV